MNYEVTTKGKSPALLSEIEYTEWTRRITKHGGSSAIGADGMTTIWSAKIKGTVMTFTVTPTNKKLY